MASIPNLVFYEGVMVYAHLEGKEGKQLLLDWLKDADSREELLTWTENFWSDLKTFRKPLSFGWTLEHEKTFWKDTYWNDDRVIPQNFNHVHVEEEESEEDSVDSEESEEEEMDDDDLRFPDE
jgi:hypothetical protein